MLGRGSEPEPNGFQNPGVGADCLTRYKRSPYRVQYPDLLSRQKDLVKHWIQVIPKPCLTIEVRYYIPGPPVSDVYEQHSLVAGRECDHRQQVPSEVDRLWLGNILQAWPGLRYLLWNGGVLCTWGSQRFVTTSQQFLQLADTLSRPFFIFHGRWDSIKYCYLWLGKLNFSDCWKGRFRCPWRVRYREMNCSIVYTRGRTQRSTKFTNIKTSVADPHLLLCGSGFGIQKMSIRIQIRLWIPGGKH